MTPISSALREKQVDVLRQAVMLAVLNIDLESNGITPDGNVRERLVAALNKADELESLLSGVVLPSDPSEEEKAPRVDTSQLRHPADNPTAANRRS